MNDDLTSAGQDYKPIAIIAVVLIALIGGGLWWFSRSTAPANAPYPDGFKPAPAPYGVSFTGMACSEPRLIELAYAFEQATKRRVPPPSAP